MAPPRRILRARRQRQLEGARRGQRVLVEHLVEVPHAEEDDRVAVLPLGVEVLPHRGSRAGRFGRRKASGGGTCWRREYNIEHIGFPVLILALDTTTRAGSLAIVRDGASLAEIAGDDVADPRRSGCRPTSRASANEPRVPAARRRALRRRGRPGLVHRPAIGIATIQGLAMAFDREVVPVSTLEAIAERPRRPAPAPPPGWMRSAMRCSPPSPARSTPRRARPEDVLAAWLSLTRLARHRVPR